VTIASALAQDVPIHELIVAGCPDTESAPSEPRAENGPRVRVLPDAYRNRAAACNAALRDATGEFVLFLFNDSGPVTLKLSAVRAMLMAATRQSGAAEADPSLRPEQRLQPLASVGMVYADYERIESDGHRREIHLLDWHPGRLRDTVDFGSLILFRAAALREIGGFDESYDAADVYDLRLRLLEKYRAVHISNRFAGALYTVAATAKAHNVFDYLLAGKAAQLEMERACTAHLKRTGAYLAPVAHVRTVTYSAEEERRFADCLASVVIPVHQRPGFIGRAIESVQAQTERRVEVIIVVNGGPEDPTAAEVRRHMPGGDRYQPAAPPVRLIVVDVNNIGLCLNTGIAAARGKYYVQLDSDDRLKPDAVEKLLTVFDSDPTIGMVIGSYEVWTLDEQSGELRRNQEISVVTHPEWTAHNGRNNLLRINGAGAPRAAHVKLIRELGWFGVNDSPHCRNYGEDYDLVLRMSEHHTIGRVWDPIYEVIRHSGGTDHSIDQATIDRNDEAKDHMRFEALKRRRRLNCECKMQNAK
jgi:glycosyltransferase involved in cell wall biosynthesis